MKRNMELIREILLAVESGYMKCEIAGYDEDSIKYHQALAIEANLVQGKVLNNLSNVTQIPSAVLLSKLTWEGHEFIDLMRRADIWNTIQREFKEESLGTIVKVAKELAEGWAKKKLNEILKIHNKSRQVRTLRVLDSLQVAPLWFCFAKVIHKRTTYKLPLRSAL